MLLCFTWKDTQNMPIILENQGMQPEEVKALDLFTDITCHAHMNVFKDSEEST